MDCMGPRDYVENRMGLGGAGFPAGTRTAERRQGPGGSRGAARKRVRDGDERLLGVVVRGIWEDRVDRSETLTGDGQSFRDPQGGNTARGFFGSLWKMVLQAALRLRADISFAAVDVFIIVAGYTMATALRMLDVAVAEPWR